MVDEALFSSARDDWRTPRWLFEGLNARYRFTLDAAADATNALCANYYSIEDNALVQPWRGRVWCNPPYGRNVTGRWVAKGFYESCTNADVVVMLLPARTDTRWFHAFVLPFAKFDFLPGRLKFDDGKDSAPFPSMLAVFGGARV